LRFKIEKLAQMRYLIARLFQLLFKIKFLQHYYFAVYKKLFKPTNLFKGLSLTCEYASTLKIIADLDDWIQQHIFFTGNYDSQGVGFLNKCLAEGDTFIDIGANIGCYTLAGSKLVGNSGRVIAFEPVDIVSNRLEQNIALNKLENITVVRKAIYDDHTFLNLHIASQENLGMSSIHRHESESGRILNVEAITLDGYLKDENIGDIKLIKIDIEGAELFALRGMTDTIIKYAPLLMVEISPQVTASALDRMQVFAFLQQYHYESYVVQENGKLFCPNDSQLTDYTNFVFICKNESASFTL
jgi:FkbM family methyltransferase